MSNFKAEINEKIFVKMIDSVKHCIAQTDNRIALMYIKLTIANDKVTASACDNCRAARTTITLAQPSAANFECYIKPIKIKPSKRGANNVVIELENNIATVEAMTEYGKIKYCFKQCVDKFVDLEKFFKDAHTLADRKIGINPSFIRQAAIGLSQVSSTKNRKYIVLETQEKNTNAFILTTKDEGIISEQLILPMRIDYDY